MIVLIGLQQCHAHNYTASLVEAPELSDSGKEALIVICLGLVVLSIAGISAHYCNFEVMQTKSYKKLEKSSEMVDIDLYESEEGAQSEEEA